MGRHSRKQGREKLLIKPLPFTVSLFPTVFFFSSMLKLVLEVPRDEATITFLKELFQSQRKRGILSFLILYSSTLRVMLSLCTTLKTIIERKMKYFSDTCIMFPFSYERNIGLKKNLWLTDFNIVLFQVIYFVK